MGVNVIAWENHMALLRNCARPAWSMRQIRVRVSAFEIKTVVLHRVILFARTLRFVVAAIVTVPAAGSSTSALKLIDDFVTC